MSKYDEFYEARRIVGQILSDDLLGPVEENEVLTEMPTQYYAMGKLYPRRSFDAALDGARNPLLETGTDAYDAAVSLSNQFNPSSMAITFMLRAEVERFTVKGGYAFYKPREIDGETTWQREPHRFEHNFSVDKNNVVELDGGLELHSYVHPRGAGGRLMTVVLLNANRSGGDIKSISERCAFQPTIRVKGRFVDIGAQKKFSSDAELLETELLYGDVKCYAQGHGCAATWDVEVPEPHWVASSFMPTFNLRQMRAAEIDCGEIFSMRFLATASTDEIIDGLKNFLARYQTWIDGLSERLPSVEKNLRGTAKTNIEHCQAAHDRIAHSIELLRENTTALRAFRLANEAMLMQRCQTLRRAGASFEERAVRWYPFQLAFILQELPSFVEPAAPDRALVDLLWFPTGGGKTEAYLGISAFVIFLRRLRAPGDDGVTVIMRYTLRLLTLQQFERASILIFACELLRQKYNLGGSEISIGLWVGGGLTPNKMDETRRALNKLKAGVHIADGDTTPYQIKICPWCGAKLRVEDYDVRGARMTIRCRNPKCAFHDAPEGLPLHIIDEAIYEYLPTFIVATVDKFAQLPLNDKPAALFGITSNKKPPELIIQDELHLISGPLGTIAGIYEAAITKFCERDGIGAKIIASTATIRNAREQILNLYGKKHSQFPPQGFSARDSFFAVEASPEKRPARLYVGVMGIGITATAMMIKIFAALLFATRYLAAANFSDAVVDNFWTIVGYFNSLRELGGACTQIVDDVQSRFSYLARTKFAMKYPAVNAAETYDHFEELTSRMNYSEITSVIQDRLKRRYTAAEHRDVYDFVLASNMISVGVDVGRLGLMAVVGQPKVNAEYIQSTSRVGRDNPGLVVTIYNASRSRDRSHYEQFLKYHSALYRYVEATSLTPFADRARDRGLQALYVSLCRYLIEELRENERAVEFDHNDPKVKAVEQTILDWIKRIAPSEIDAVKRELLELAHVWSDETDSDLVYKNYTGKRSLLKNDVDGERFSVMNSMRSVDGQAGIYLLGRN